MSQEKTIKTTTDIDSLRSEIRDKSVRVIDVRREEDYKQSHIPTAVNLPLANLLSDDSPERVLKLVNAMGIGDETRVVVYDDTLAHLHLELLGHWNILVTLTCLYLKQLLVNGNHLVWKVMIRYQKYKAKNILFI